jgi:hypothetical protein
MVEVGGVVPIHGWKGAAPTPADITARCRKEEAMQQVTGRQETAR